MIARELERVEKRRHFWLSSVSPVLIMLAGRRGDHKQEFLLITYHYLLYCIHCITRFSSPAQLAPLML